jgi:hypothetical protein
MRGDIYQMLETTEWNPFGDKGDTKQDTDPYTRLKQTTCSETGDLGNHPVATQ